MFVKCDIMVADPELAGSRIQLEAPSNRLLSDEFRKLSPACDKTGVYMAQQPVPSCHRGLLFL